MFDLHIVLPNIPGALALMGETLAEAGISIEGGGIWPVNGVSHGHFLFSDGDAARKALEGVDIRVESIRPVALLRLRQAVPGQLGLLARRMADAGVNIDVQYSDHDNQLVLVTDNAILALQIAENWKSEGNCPSASYSGER